MPRRAGAGPRTALGIAVAAALLVARLVAAPPIDAHSELLTSVPEAGAELGEAPTSVALTFTDPLSDASTLVVVDAGFQTVVAGPVRFDPAQPNVLAIQLVPLSGGDYTVQYHAVEAQDGHAVDGSFGFRVRGAEAPSAPAPSEPVAAAATGAAPPASVDAPIGGAQDGSRGTRGLIGVAVAALTLVGLTRWRMARRRAARRGERRP